MIQRIRAKARLPRVYSAIFVIAYFLASFVNYLFGVGLSWFLTPDQFGVLGVAQSLLLMGGLVVGSGFAWTSTRILASQGTNDQSRAGIRTSLLANIILGIVLGFGLWIFYLNGWIPLGPIYSTVTPLIALTMTILSARAVLNGAGRGIYRFSWVAVNLVLEVLIKAGVGLWFVISGAGVNGVMAAFAIGAFFSLLHSIWIIKPIHLWQGKSWIDRSVFTSTVPIFLAMLGPALMVNLDILGLKLLSPPQSADRLAGYYQAAAILARAPVFIAQAFTHVLFSRAAGSQKDLPGNTNSNGNQYLQTALRLWLWILLPASLGMILLPKVILSILFPDAYLIAAPTLQIASVGGALLALVTLFSGVLQALGETRYSVFAAISATIAQVFTLVWAIPYWGAAGAAWSLIVAGAIALLLFIPALKGIGFRPRLLPIRIEHYLDN